MTDIERVLVVGATGNIGRIAVQLLHERGLRVRGLARDPGGLPAGVEAVRADLRDVAALRAAAQGVDAALLIWPFMTAEGIEEVVAALPARVVYVSAMSVRDDAPPERNGVWGRVEAAIRDAGDAWTFLRPSGFATNTLQWAPAVRAGEPVRIPSPRAARSLIHERDIAESAVAVLSTPGHERRTYVLTGPAAITQAEQVGILGATAVEATREQARAEMLGWADPAFADAALDYWASLVDNPEPVTDGVRELTGYPARSFAEWAADHAADFRAPSVAEVAHRYADALAAGHLDRALALYDAGAVRVAPLEGGGELRGPAAILDNGRRLAADLDIHGVTVRGPYVGADGFAVQLAFDQTDRRSGERSTRTKLSLLTVERGAIVREQVHYLDPPA